MNVASLELCKALYEVSGWKTGSDKPTWNGRKGVNSAPAYPLGYLLRKLPPNKAIEYDEKVKKWAAIWSDSFDFKRIEADTPEDAAAKLCIELFKQNILTRESN